MRFTIFYRNAILRIRGEKQELKKRKKDGSTEIIVYHQGELRDSQAKILKIGRINKKNINSSHDFTLVQLKLIPRSPTFI